MQQASGSGRALKIVQFTDTHLFGSAENRLMGVDTALTFQQVFQLANQQRRTPDFYLLTGDLSQDETEESYRRFSQVLCRLAAPAFYLPGNHDSHLLMEKCFSTAVGPFKADTGFVKDDWLVVLLDTHVEGQVPGHLSNDELERLDQQLTKHAGIHALVVMHHHPLPSGAKWLDRIGLDNRDDFLKVLDSHACVRGVLFGHIHQEFDTWRNGVRFMATPSTCVQFKPHTDNFAVDALPPGYRWLELDSDGTIRSAVARVAAVAPGVNLASAGY